MGRKYFGTDGVRGKVGEYPITPEFAMHLGYSAGKVLAGADWHLAQGERPGVLIGKDTRISGYMLEAALESGIVACGGNAGQCKTLAHATSGAVYAAPGYLLYGNQGAVRARRFTGMPPSARMTGPQPWRNRLKTWILSWSPRTGARGWSASCWAAPRKRCCAAPNAR